MDISGSNVPLPTFAQPWGGALTATFIACIIYGITVLQTFIYYTTYPGDRRPWKVLVAVVFILDTAALGLFLYCMHYYLVLSWGVPEMTAIDVKPFPAEYVLTSVLVFIVQLFYINIVRALCAPIILTLILFFLSLAALATGLVLPAIQLKLHYIPVIVADQLNHDMFNAARTSALACDLGIVTSLCWLFYRRKSDASSANSMINVLMVVALQRGVLQTLVQAGEVVAYVVQPKNVYFLPFHVIVSRVYCTSLLATLNTREYALTKSQLSSPPSYDTALNDARRRGVFSTIIFDPPFLGPQDAPLAHEAACPPEPIDIEISAAHATSSDTAPASHTEKQRLSEQVPRARRKRRLTAAGGRVEIYELEDFSGSERARAESDASRSTRTARTRRPRTALT